MWISKAIIQSFMKDFIDYTDIDVVIREGIPARLTTGYYPTKAGLKVTLFERKLEKSLEKN